MMDPNWDRWFYASCSKYFYDARGTYHMFIEGHDRTTEQYANYFEFRFDGPFCLEISRDYWQIDVEINILIAASKNDNDTHLIYKMCGLIRSAFTAIPIHKYGTGEDDDQSYLTCLTLLHSFDGREALRVTHFGQIDPTKQLLQASVEGHFRTYLKV